MLGAPDHSHINIATRSRIVHGSEGSWLMPDDNIVHGSTSSLQQCVVVLCHGRACPEESPCTARAPRPTRRTLY